MTKEELLKVIDKYYQEYKLPEFRMSDGDMDAFLNILANHFPNKVADIVYVILRKAFNIAMLNNDGYFTLYYIIVSLSELAVFNVSNDEINIIKQEIAFESIKNSTKQNVTVTR